MIDLRAGGATCTVSPDDGGRIAGLDVHGRQLLVTREPGSPSMSWGWYPTVPFCGRVRNGRFVFEGHEFQLELNMPPHAIHGTVYGHPWSVSDVGPGFVSMSCGLDDHWPFGGSATQRIEFTDGRLECRVAVHADDLAMPAQVGWHPWFVKPTAAHLEAGRMYLRDEAGIPTGELVDPPSGPWDDCFLDPRAPFELTYGEPADDGGLAVRVESDCDHWVIYDEQDNGTCVEPQSGPPDGFNLGGGSFVRLAPGESLERTMAISWRRA